MAVTSKDIADICGISQGTVDRAFNNRPGINPETKRKILDTASRLGYRPHLLARSLVKGKTMTIGLIVFDLYNRFFAQLVNAIEFNARKQGYFIYLTLTNKIKEEEKSCIEHLADRQVDGLILCSVHNESEFAEYLVQLKTPVVTIGNRISPLFPFVGIDDYFATKDAVKYLIAKGYKKIVYVSPPLSDMGQVNLYALERRLLGYTEAMKEVGLGMEPLVIDSKDYIQRIDSFQIKKNEKTAVLCSNDIYSLEILNNCKIKKISVPENMGLMGFDNIDILNYIQPSLTTVAYPLEKLGEKAVECLLAQMQVSKNTGDFILNHKIIEGFTT